MTRNQTLFIAAAALAAGCSGGSPGTPTTAVPTATPGRTAALALYPGHGPSTTPPSGIPAVTSTTLVLRNGAGGPPGSHYLVDDPGYTGSFSFASSCAPQTVATAWFENGIVIGNPPSTYSFGPGATGSGPAALLDVTSTGIFGPQTCTFSIDDAAGHSATIAVTNEQLLLYQNEPGPQPRAGATGTSYALLANFSPTNFLVYEQGYSGSYTLAPYTCQEFSATLTPGSSPSSGAMLSVNAAASPGPEPCTFVVSAADGQTAATQAYYEGF